MRKRVFGRHLSRDKGSRAALIRSLMVALIERGKIETTKAKVKTIVGDIDNLVRLAKGSDKVAAKRRILSILANDKKSMDAFFAQVVPVFTERAGGYTKITYLPNRKGDGSKMARLEWSAEIKAKEEPKIKSKSKSKSKKETKEKAKKES